MDDAFAISFALRNQDIFDIKLISTVSLNTTKRAILLSAFLSVIGYNNIDIAIGFQTYCNNNPSYIYDIQCVGPIWPWIHTINPSSYKGNIYKNGINKMTKIIEQHSPSNPIYIISIGPMDNLAAIFSTNPSLRNHIRLFTMSGSLFSNSKPYGKFAEWNILSNVTAAQIVYNSRIKYPFNTPIVDVTWDTGYQFQIEGDQYQSLLQSENILAKTLIAMYAIQFVNGGDTLNLGAIMNPKTTSPCMYDLEITWLTWYIAQKLLRCDRCDFEDVLRGEIPYMDVGAFKISINDSGYMVSDVHMPISYSVMKWRADGSKAVAQEVVDAILRENIVMDSVRESTISNSVMDYIATIAFVLGFVTLILFGCRLHARKEYQSI